MAISERSVKNKRNSAGELTGKAGIVYDVNIKYKENGQPKTHTKKGFSTKREAQQYEAAIKNKLSNPSYVPPTAAQRKKTLGAYLDEWIVRHGESNLRPSTYASYHSNIQVHIKPALGECRCLSCLLPCWMTFTGSWMKKAYPLPLSATVIAFSA